MKPKCYILILNWNGWKDTIECLESVFRINYDNYQVIVCDNDSQDNSMDHIKSWARGKQKVFVDKDHPLSALSTPPIEKPVIYKEFDRKQAEEGRTKEDEKVPLILIRTGGNLGFAGGNNVGLRYILKKDSFDYVWLVNNDTVVDPDCLKNMISYSSKRLKPNTCGSKLLFYDNPDVIQALGGVHYNKWTGLAETSLGRYKSIHEKIDQKQFESRLSYIAGASWLIPKQFLIDIGIMEESYFLYCEEVDWCVRGAKKYELCYANDALVYHKEGSSIGSPSGERSSSLLSDFYIFRNKLNFTRKYFPEAIITAYITTFIQALNRLRRGQLDKARLILKIMLGKNKFN